MITKVEERHWRLRRAKESISIARIGLSMQVRQDKSAPTLQSIFDLVHSAYLDLEAQEKAK